LATIDIAPPVPEPELDPGPPVEAGPDQVINYGDTVVLEALINWSKIPFLVEGIYSTNPLIFNSVSGTWEITGLVAHDFSPTHHGELPLTIQADDPLYDTLFSPGMTVTARFRIGIYRTGLLNTFHSFEPVPFSQSSDSLTLTFVPEPTSLALFALSGTVVLRRQNRLSIIRALI